MLVKQRFNLRYSIRVGFAFLGCLIAISTGEEVIATEFFRPQARHSLNSIFGVPSPVPPALEASQTQLFLSGSYSNQFAGGRTGSEFLLLDGERAETRLSGFRVVKGCVAAGFEIPLIAHSSGYFDRAIEDWHAWFDLPNGNREDTDPNQLAILYQISNAETASGQRLNLRSTSTSVGDIHVQLLRPAGCLSVFNFATNVDLRIGIKLPTGDSSLLTGSGGTDIYVDMTSSDLLRANAFALRASVGVLALGDSDIISNHKSVAAYGNIVIGWQYRRSLELLVQVDWHTALFDSELRELGSFAAQMSVGGRFQLNGNRMLDIALLEDIEPDTGPDVGLYLGYAMTF